MSQSPECKQSPHGQCLPSNVMSPNANFRREAGSAQLPLYSASNTQTQQTSLKGTEHSKMQ